MRMKYWHILLVTVRVCCNENHHQIYVYWLLQMRIWLHTSLLPTHFARKSCYWFYKLVNGQTKWPINLAFLLHSSSLIWTTRLIWLCVYNIWSIKILLCATNQALSELFSLKIQFVCIFAECRESDDLICIFDTQCSVHIYFYCSKILCKQISFWYCLKIFWLPLKLAAFIYTACV